VRKISLIPARLYQRYRSLFDRLLPALGMAGLFTLTAQATGAFSPEWIMFIAAGVLIAGLVAPAAGYVLFILALALPLFSISIYVAALALAVLILPSFFLTRHIAAVVLVLAAPVLSRYRIALMIPFLAGIWWGEWGGVLVGLGSASWLKLLAGMCGAAPDLAQLSGQPLAADSLIARFREANSLQTLLWSVEPLVSDPQVLLLHILQILAWGLAGYGVGLVRHRIDGMQRPGVGLLAAVSAGLLGFGIGGVGAPAALGLADVSAVHLSFLAECAWNGVCALGLYAAYRSLARPAVSPAPGRASARRRSARPSPRLDPAPAVRPQPRDEEQVDIIMLDLD